MKYYEQDSIPLKEVFPGIGERAYDEFGNLIEIDAFGEPTVIKRTVLGDNEKVNEFKKESFLHGFWAWSKKRRIGDEIPDPDRE